MNYILFILTVIVIISCSSNKEVTLKNQLPSGNMESVNDSLAQIAPTQRPLYYYNDEPAKHPFVREQLITNTENPVSASSQIGENELSLSFIEDKWKKYLTSNIESISFISKDRGFITFSHPFDPEFAKRFNINIKNQSGGTDIYEFALNPEKGFEFENLAPLEALNTSFWESHPFAADTILSNGDRVTLLLWSSDRDNPYSKRIDKEGKVKIKGNTDLYYAFRINDQWSNVKKFDKLNNNSNQGSPFIYCLCSSEPTLFYSSNEDGNENDFDIFYTKLNIDFESQKISELANPTRFKKLGQDSLSKQDSLVKYELINSKFDERFPFVPFPYKNDNKLYFSSNRFSRKYKINDSTALKAKGDYDIYALKLNNEEFPCIPPEISVEYNLTVLNSSNSSEEIIGLEQKLNNGATLISSKGNNFRYKLELDKEYEAFGGSNFSETGFDCQSMEDGVLAGYVAPKVDESNIEYEQISETSIKKIELKDKVKIGSTTSELLIDTIDYNGLKVIEKEVITKTVITIDEKNKNYSVQETKSKLKAKENSIQLKLGERFQFEDVSNLVSGPEVASLLTMRGEFNTKNINESTVIYDTVYLAPVYKEAYDIKLKVYVLDKCTGKSVLDPVAKLVKNGQTISEGIVKSNYIEFSLKCGEQYNIYGGSTFKSEKISNIDFPEKPYLRYFDADNISIEVNGANILSEKSKYGGLNTNQVSSDVSYTDTVFIHSTPNIAYSVELKNAKREKVKIKDPIILIKNISTNKELKIEKDKFSFYPNPNHQYKVLGGSNYLGDDCDEESNYITRAYYEPKFENGVYKLEGDYKNVDLNKYSKVNGPSVKSLYSYNTNISILGNEECKSKVIQDLVYLVPEEYIKPPCSIEFVNFEGYHRNVPYFQTGFWEVNTEENYPTHLNRLESGFQISDSKINRKRSDYTVVNEASLYPIIKNDGLTYDIANARWIELHPNNYYWGWRDDLFQGTSKERVEKRENRKEEYKEYSKQVNENLDLMSNRIVNDIIPKFKEILKFNPENTGTKLLIEIKALSDKRGVERGWYIGNENIKYTASFYDRYSDRIINRMINIEAPKVDETNKKVTEKTNLGMSNRVLSDLRAWFGYNEIFNRLKKDSEFNSLLNSRKVLTPETKDRDLDNYQIIILANGEDVDEYAEAKIKMYDKSRRKLSFFTYDQTRRVEVIISIVSYQNGKIILSDCCNESLEYTESVIK